MIAKRFLAGGLSLLIAGSLATSAVAGPRLYRGENTWYAVSGGAIAYSVFVADGMDGARSYGADTAADGVYTRIKASTPASFKRLGVTLQDATECTEAADKNPRGVPGWSFTCVFPIAAPGAAAPEAPATTVATAPPTQAASPTAAPKPAAPAPTAVASTKPAPPPAAKPAPAQPAQPAAPTTVLATAPAKPVAPPATAPAPAAVASTEGDADLNSRVKAQLDAIDARNAARAAEFEAAKKATSDAYAAQVAAYQAQVQETERKRQADLDAWKARVAACKAGDVSQCGQ